MIAFRELAAHDVESEDNAQRVCDRAGVSVVIVSFNTRELTVACLESVFQADGENVREVLVVDNGSRDGSVEEIKQRFPQVRLLEARENLGFAKANNWACMHVCGDWLLLLNPDTVVLDGAIEKLRGFAESHPEGSIFGGRTLFPDGRLNLSYWARPTPWTVFCVASGLTGLFARSNLFARESYGSWQCDTVREVDIVSGCFFLIRRSLWEELGGFDPAFFMYGEEADLCLRAAKLGHKCMICPDATIIHYGGASETVRADMMVRLFKAKEQLFARHWPRWQLPIGIALLDMWAVARLVSFGATAKFRSKYREKYDTWRDIWNKRSAWHAPQQVVPEEGTKVVV